MCRKQERGRWRGEKHEGDEKHERYHFGDVEERKKGGGIEHKDVEERWAKKGVEWK